MVGIGARLHKTLAMGAMITHTSTNVSHGDDKLFVPTEIRCGGSSTCAVTVEEKTRLNTIIAANALRGWIISENCLVLQSEFMINRQIKSCVKNKK